MRGSWRERKRGRELGREEKKEKEKESYRDRENTNRGSRSSSNDTRAMGGIMYGHAIMGLHVPNVPPNISPKVLCLNQMTREQKSRCIWETQYFS